MKFIDIKIEPMGHVYNEQDMLILIGQVAGTCYNSSLDNDACIKRALGCIKRGHHSPWEHALVTLKSTVDRGVSHALVRHRHCAFQQSSTIYQHMTDDLHFIAGSAEDKIKAEVYKKAEEMYHSLLDAGVPPSNARDVLPNALATDLIITTNIRQWLYMCKRRVGAGDSENMHKWAHIVYDWFLTTYPQITKAFDEWYGRHPL